MSHVDVGAFAELREGVPMIVNAGRREIVLVLWRNEVFALRNICPHQTQSFCGGTVALRLSGGSGSGDMLVNADEPVLACPWHFWRFELRSGACVADPSLRVATYEVTVRNGRILLNPEAKRARRSPSPRNDAAISSR